jgi:hypothetical protein
MSKNQNIKWIEQGKRLSILLKKIKVTQTRLAEIAGTKQSSVSHAVNAVMGIPIVWLYRLKEEYSEVNPKWVLTGEGEPLVSAQRYLDMVAVDADILEDGATVAYEASNARPLRSEEIAVILARLQHEVSELQTWQAEAGRVIAALEVQVKRLKGE